MEILTAVGHIRFVFGIYLLRKLKKKIKCLQWPCISNHYNKYSSQECILHSYLRLHHMMFSCEAFKSGIKVLLRGPGSLQQFWIFTTCDNAAPEPVGLKVNAEVINMNQHTTNKQLLEDITFTDRIQVYALIRLKSILANQSSLRLLKSPPCAVMGTY